ncbi:hypothetical protein [Fictibacillus barbaricus]|uniref:DUF1292 domain-containing protein n=1 Tax=Fictibacillus barbaricus TaxID=182136 RepID=A0ABS2ZG04_9BACL|nr:hypothetical protein [Fictibacillus barbaricus]MBN3546691.1 hypothetical protein [Fictibacillus barbaricus]GGB43055.1 hypothetical protein GCM10007199_05450 [Fictibacillus barbaricus]
MVKPEVKLIKINDIKEIKDETYREYLYSIEEKYYLFSVHIGENVVAVCNIKKEDEKSYEIVDYIGSESCIKLIEEKLMNFNPQ